MFPSTTARPPRQVLRSIRVAVLLGVVLMATLSIKLVVSPASPAAEAPPAPVALPPLPAGWPDRLQIGTADSPGGAATMKATTGYALRYQYLAGGVNTGHGWATWNPHGSFVTSYVQESVEHGIIPVFTYYMIYQSAPGNTQTESQGVYANLQDAATMRAYYGDLKLFFERAGAFPTELVVLHVEPDLWAYAQQRARGDDAGTVPVKVAATDLPEVAGLPDTLSGFARAIVALRDAYAPNVLLGYHVSTWGSGVDVLYSKPPDTTVDALTARAADFYHSLGASFDLVFAEFSDRDAAFKQHQYKDGGRSWWRPDDFRRHLRFLGRFVDLTQRRIVVWQIPQGNTRMRAMDNTWNHYQDNKVEWLLDEPSRAHLDQYAQAGVVAFLFGRGADGATCSCDANDDGVTNPAPINGNTGASLNADDDGGYFHHQAQEYYAGGPLPLPPPAAVAPE